LIDVEKTNYPVAVICRVLEVNRTAFYNWERRAPSDRALTVAWLTEQIKQIHEESRGVYGRLGSTPSSGWSTGSGSGARKSPG
jgi:hypothetical protein